MTFTPPPLAASPRPSRLTLYFVLLWVVEGLIVLFALYSLLMLVPQLLFGPHTMGAASGPLAPAVAALQRELFERSLPGVQAARAAAQIPLSGLVIWTSIQVYGRDAAALARLRSLLVVAIGYAGFAALVATVIQLRILGPMAEYLEAVLRVSSAGRPPPPEVRTILAYVPVFAGVVGVLTTLIALAVKATVYLLARSFLGRPEMTAFCAPRSG